MSGSCMSPDKHEVATFAVPGCEVTPAVSRQSAMDKLPPLSCDLLAAELAHLGMFFASPIPRIVDPTVKYLLLLANNSFESM